MKCTSPACQQGRIKTCKACWRNYDPDKAYKPLVYTMHKVKSIGLETPYTCICGRSINVRNPTGRTYCKRCDGVVLGRLFL